MLGGVDGGVRGVGDSWLAAVVVVGDLWLVAGVVLLLLLVVIFVLGIGVLLQQSTSSTKALSCITLIAQVPSHGTSSSLLISW